MHICKLLPKILIFQKKYTCFHWIQKKSQTRKQNIASLNYHNSPKLQFHSMYYEYQTIKPTLTPVIMKKCTLLVHLRHT